MQVTHSTTSSTLYINATDTNATIHNGVYQCTATLIIYGEDEFTKLSSKTEVILSGITNVCICQSACYCYLHIQDTCSQLHEPKMSSSDSETYDYLCENWPWSYCLYASISNASFKRGQFSHVSLPEYIPSAGG